MNIIANTELKMFCEEILYDDLRPCLLLILDVLQSSLLLLYKLRNNKEFFALLRAILFALFLWLLSQVSIDSLHLFCTAWVDHATVVILSPIAQATFTAGI